MSAQRWQVVGGGSQGGILVRSGRELNSAEASSRLATGALIQETELQGERLCYELLEGEGPCEGWVSVKLKGKDLVVKTEREPSPTAPPPWLRPDGAGGKKILFLTIPWKGHIIHLRRIAEWFEAAGGYELSAAIFPESEGVMPACCKLYHLPEDDRGGQAFLAEVEDSFRRLAIEAKDYKAGLGGFNKLTMRLLGEQTAQGKDPMASIFGFYVRAILDEKPDIVVGDGFFHMFGLVPGFCNAENLPLLGVSSPGITERWSESDEPSGLVAMNFDTTGMSEEDMELTAKAIGLPVEAVKLGQKASTGELPAEQMQQLASKMPSSSEMTLAALTMSLGNPAVAPFMITPIARKLGIKPKQAGKMVRGMLDVPQTPTLFPSSRALLYGTTAAPGGLHTGPFLPLPQPLEGGVVQRERAAFEATLAPMEPELLEWLFGSEDPIVYMAFGSIVRPNKDIVDRLVAALDGGEWRVLWALPSGLHTLLPQGLAPARWRVENFVPQADVLKCARVRCFVTHSGANSTVESLACGVPMVCMPFYMDQYDWARLVCERRGAGVQVDKLMPAPELRAAVQRAMTEPEIRKKAEGCAALMRAQEGLVLDNLPAAMAPRCKTVGSGVSLAAACVLAMLKRKEPWFLIALAESTAEEALAKVAAADAA